MKTGPFFERSRHTRKVPHVFVGIEPIHAILRSQNPSVIRHAAFGVSPFVSVNQLAGRWHGDRVRVERELLGVFDKIEQVRV